MTEMKAISCKVVFIFANRLSKIFSMKTLNSGQNIKEWHRIYKNTQTYCSNAIQRKMKNILNVHS